METHIVRQPILDHNQKLVAYELIYFQDSNIDSGKADSEVANIIISFFNELHTDSLLNDKDCFLTFSPKLLSNGIPEVFDQSKLVIQVEDSILINPEAHKIMEKYKEKGYRIAIIGFDFNRRFLNVMPEIDIIKIDFSDINSDKISSLCQLGKRFNKKLVAYGINSTEARDLAIANGCDYLQGEDVSEMMTTKVHNMEHLQSNFFRLVAAISKEMPEFDEISEIISLDVTLTFSVLKMVNSAYFAMKNEVTDVKQALTILGMKQLKQWIYLLSFSDEGGVGDELIRISFLRAVFCQEISKNIPQLSISSQEAYMLGMFSTLGIMLEVPIESAVEKLPLSDALKNGLIKGEGPEGTLLALCLSYEKGRWSEAYQHIDELNLTGDIVRSRYMEAIDYVDEIWSDLNKASR